MSGLEKITEPWSRSLRRVAGDVDEVVVGGDDLDLQAYQLIVEPVDRRLVARDDPAGEDHGIARVERDIAVLAVSDAPQGRARLALTAGAQIENVFRR